MRIKTHILYYEYVHCARSDLHVAHYLRVLYTLVIMQLL